MNYWESPPEKITGENVVLRIMEKEHLPELQQVADNKKIWTHYAFDCSEPRIFSREFNRALEEKEKRNQFPFVIFNKQENKMLGSTRLLYLQPAHRKLEIGWTWLSPDYWHTAVNAECKLLLLTYCFETMKTIRVQLKTDENNVRSKRAIEKIGGRFEGVLRNDMIRDNGTFRHSAYYSIIEEEWPEKKRTLIKNSGLVTSV